MVENQKTSCVMCGGPMAGSCSESCCDVCMGYDTEVARGMYGEQEPEYDEATRDRDA